MGFLDDITELQVADLNNKTSPKPAVIDWFHKQASTKRDEDLHHQLGNGATQAAFGDHAHDGKRGVALWAATDVPPDLLGTPTTTQIKDTVNAVLAMMRQKAR